MRAIYIADDDTQFDDQYECEAYERRLYKWSRIKESRFWNDLRKPMTTEEWLDNAESCDYMEVANNEEAKLILEYLREELGLCHPWPDWRVDNPTAGRYYYNRTDDEWHHLDTELALLAQIMKIFEG